MTSRHFAKLSVTVGLLGLLAACGPKEQQSAERPDRPGAASARNYISIVGSSTVYPFSTVVAERFGRASKYGTPKVEATGSGGGFKLFCAGVGVSHPDITNSSRRIKASEVADCAAHGVDEIVEVKIGYDGIVLASSVKSEVFSLSRKDIFTALAKQLPSKESPGQFVANPFTHWNEINEALPKTRIEVLGPPPTSGTRDAFVELAMEGGCIEFAAIKTLKDRDAGEYTAICHSVREDGVFVETGENDNLIVQKLYANPDALGIFGFSFLDQNSDKVQGSPIDGVAPTFDAIADGSYPISRPLYFYIKKAHIGVIPGIEEFLMEFTSDRAWGDEGYLSDRGLIPLPHRERSEVQAAVRELRILDLASS